MHKAADTWAGLALGRLKAIRCDSKFMMLMFLQYKDHGNSLPAK